MSNALERFYQGMGNVVLRDSNNRPSVFVKHVLQNSSEFDASLPEHPHPAFVVGETTDPALYIAKYLNTTLTSGGTLYSLPNAVPDYAYGYYSELNRMRSFGNNVSGLTIADHGLLVLMAHKNKWISHGNNRAGCDYRDGQAAWSSASVSYAAGYTVLYRGYKWTCLKAHTSSASLTPELSPSLWEKTEKVGGTVIPEEFSLSDSGLHTLTGSGPVNWCMLSDPELETDVQGQGDCLIYGVRLYNGEIQILPNNDAADPDADMSQDSSAWKAILPSQNDNSYTLVAPGTEGTVHFYKTGTANNTPLKLVARALEDAELTGYSQQAFTSVINDPTSLPYIPSILYELGLAPLPNTTVDGTLWIQFGKNKYFGFFGNRNSTQGNGAGIAGMRCLEIKAAYSASDYRYYISRARARATA